MVGYVWDTNSCVCRRLNESMIGGDPHKSTKEQMYTKHPMWDSVVSHILPVATIAFGCLAAILDLVNLTTGLSRIPLRSENLSRLPLRPDA